MMVQGVEVGSTFYHINQTFLEAINNPTRTPATPLAPCPLSALRQA